MSSRSTLVAAAALLSACLLAPSAAGAAPLGPCPSKAAGAETSGVTTTRSITGTFSTAQRGHYVLVPFDVPAGTTQVRVRYCWSDPSDNTLDLGIYQPNANGTLGYAIPRNFRGWGGSSHPDVALSPQGFSTDAEYTAKPNGYLPGRTTRGFLPGRIGAGTWAAELGVGAVRSTANGGNDTVDWRVDVELSNDPAYRAEPYAATPYDKAPAKREAGWYAGDFHVHSEHSNLGASTIADTLRDAFSPFTPAQDGAPFAAGLDFTALSDYVTDSAWGEIGKYQKRYPGRLIIPSAEVITYMGHAGNQGSGKVADYRTGEIDLRSANGSLKKLRGPRPPSTIFDTIHSGKGVAVINHPRIFPPTTEAVAALCRGCFWGYSDRATDFAKVDAIELFNSPENFNFRHPGGPETANPFNRDALVYWAHALESGHHIAAVGGSDTHHAGSPTGATEAPVGRPATVVYAPELSEQGILDGVRAGHTYVKTAGTAGPDVRLTASAGKRTVIMGDTISGPGVRIEATISKSTDGLERTLELLRDGKVVKSAPVLTPTASVTLTGARPGRYAVLVERKPGASVIDAVSSPVYVEGVKATLTAPKGCVKRNVTARAAMSLDHALPGSLSVRLDGRRLKTARGTKQTTATVSIARLQRGSSHRLTVDATTAYGSTATAARRIVVCR